MHYNRIKILLSSCLFTDRESKHYQPSDEQKKCHKPVEKTSQEEINYKEIDQNIKDTGYEGQCKFAFLKQHHE